MRVGRKFFYDALLTPSNGEANCNVCHPGADKDDLAWDLGSPFQPVTANSNPRAPTILANFGAAEFNPLKGPMTVLTLRGIGDGGPMFWRGDATNTVDILDERANFQNFNVVFEALLGRETGLSQPDFDAFTDWALSIVPPPNPHRSLDNQLTAEQAEGRALYFGSEGGLDVGIATYNECHGLGPSQGFFGTRGEFVPEGQNFKVTGLRPVYDKIGAFGRNFGQPGDPNVSGGPRTKPVGPQIRGFGTLHDGSMASMEEFLAFPGFSTDARQVARITDFVFAFPTNLAPIVGQQATLRADSAADVLERIDLFEQRAAAPFATPIDQTVSECELVAKAVVGRRERGFLFEPASDRFLDDLGGSISREDLRAIARVPGQEVMFTCTHSGGGRRLAIDRDLDGTLNGEETPANVLARLIARLVRFVVALLTGSGSV